MKKILIAVITLIATTYLSIYFGKTSDKALLFFLSTFLNGLIVGSIVIFLYRVFKKTEKTFFLQFSNLFMYYVIALSIGDLFGTITVKSRIDEYKNNIVANKKKIDDTYKNLEKIAQEENKLCPKKIDNSTVINKVHYSGLDTSFNVDIKISSYSRSDLVLDELKSAINKNNLLNVSTDSTLINMKLMKVKLIYTYYDKENQYLFELKY